MAYLLHLKWPTGGRRSNAPTICGLPDPGVHVYASATSPAHVEELKMEALLEPYPLCVDCENTFKAAQQTERTQ